jgi:hypothetical protein
VANLFRHTCQHCSQPVTNINKPKIKGWVHLDGTPASERPNVERLGRI